MGILEGTEGQACEIARCAGRVGIGTLRVNVPRSPHQVGIDFGMAAVAVPLESRLLDYFP